MAPPDPRPRRRRLPRARPGPARLRPSPTVPSRSRTTTSSTSPTTCSACSTTSAPSRRSFVGHDWGSMVVGQMALLHPERVAGVVGDERAAPPPGPDAAGGAHAGSVFGDSFFYILYFQEPGRRRRRPRRRPGRDDDAACSPAWPCGERRPRRLAGLRQPTAAGSSTGCPKPDAPARLAHPGRARPLRRGVHAAPASPAASTGTATSTATGRRTAAARRRARHDAVGCSSPAALDPVIRDDPAAVDGRPRPRPPRQRRSSRAPATGSSRRRPTRSTPPCSRSSDARPGRTH